MVTEFLIAHGLSHAKTFDNLSFQELENKIKQLETENKKLKHENIQTQLLLKSSIGSANGMIALSIDEDYNYLYFNEMHRQVMKSVYGIDVAIGMNVLECINIEEDRVKAKTNYDLALRRESHSIVEAYGDAMKYYYESFFNPLVNELDAVIGVTVLAMNITEKVKVDKALIAKESKHQAVMSSISDVIGIFGSDRVLTYKSANIERLFGWKAEDMIGTDAFLNMHPDDLKKYEKIIPAFMETDNASGTFELRYKHKDGIYRWIELNAHNNSNNPSINGILINYHDISERKEANRIIKENETLYKSLFENLSNSSSLYEVILDDKGEPCDYRFIAVNPIFEASVGRTGESLIGKTLLKEFPATEPVWLDCFKKVCMSGVSDRVESYTDVLDMHFEIIAYVPQPGLMAMIGSDITERKKAELELIANQQNLKSQNEEYITLNEELNERNQEYAHLNSEYKLQNNRLLQAIEKAEESERLKTEFLSNMSHEVRTPMNGIIGFSQLLDIPDIDDEARQGYVDVIQQSSNQLLGIIDNIIEISKLGTKQVKVVNRPLKLNTFLEELQAVFSIHAETKGIDLVLKKAWENKHSNILIDEIKLYKILSNLIENAMKFTKKGFVEFGYQPTNLDKGSKALEFYVKDTGIGIFEDKIESIFVKFSQVKSDLLPQYGGLGLGLAIVKENTELMKGKVSLVSKRGEGSIFSVTVPYESIEA